MLQQQGLCDPQSPKYELLVPLQKKPADPWSKTVGKHALNAASPTCALCS